MRIWAFINNGMVANTVTWDGVTPYAESNSLVEITNMNPIPGIGWLYDGANWTNPFPPAPSYSAGTSS